MKYNLPFLTIIAFGLILSPLKARFILVQLKGKQNISNYYSDGRLNRNKIDHHIYILS